MLLAVLLAAPLGASSPASDTRDPTWSPDGTRLAYVLRGPSGAGEIFVVGFDGGARRRLTPPQIGLYGLSWSPDGRALAYAAAGDIWRVDLDSGKRTQLTSTPQLDAFQPGWSPGGTTIAFTVFEGCFRCTHIYAIDSADGQNRRLLVDGPRRPAWGRSSSMLLTSYPVSLVDVATGAVQRISAGSFASWSGDGSEFAFYGAESRPGVYVSSPTRVAPQLVWPSRKVLAYPVISPGHLRIAIVRGRRVVLLRRFLRRQVVLPRSDSPNDAPAWSFRGQLAFVADGPCGRRSEIDVVRADGSKRHALVSACS